MEQLSRNPKDPALMIVASKDAPETYSVAFDEGLAEYQVLADHPLIWVSRIRWLDQD